MRANKRPAAFTLIELLVVIAILALLVSILTPSLRKARDSARTVVCQGNVRSLLLGCRFFAEDHDGYYPGNGNQAGRGVGQYLPTGTLPLTVPDSSLIRLGYVGGRDAYTCPQSLADHPELYRDYTSKYGAGWAKTFHYGFCATLCGYQLSDTRDPLGTWWVDETWLDQPTYREDELPNPSETVLVKDYRFRRDYDDALLNASATHHDYTMAAAAWVDGHGSIETVLPAAGPIVWAENRGYVPTYRKVYRNEYRR